MRAHVILGSVAGFGLGVLTVIVVLSIVRVG